MDNRENPRKISQWPQVNRNRKSLQTVLSLVQTACLLAQEGVGRISASELADRLTKEFNVSLAAFEAGQILIDLGLKKCVIHGKSRFILEPAQLEEVRKKVSALCEEQMQGLENSIEQFKTLRAKVLALEQEWRNLQQLEIRQRELTRLIAENQDNIAKLSYLESQRKRLEQQAQRMAALERECQELTKKINELPSLENRKVTLEQELSVYEKDEQLLTEREAQFAATLNKMKERFAWVDLVTLQHNIRLKTQELEQLDSQLVDKRSLLDKLLMRRREGDK